MPHSYTEDQLVEQPAIGLFAEMEWETISAAEESFGVAGTLGRMAKSDVVLVVRLRAAACGVGEAEPDIATRSDLGGNGGGDAEPIGDEFGVSES